MAFDETKIKRHPAGSDAGGKFAPKSEAEKEQDGPLTGDMTENQMDDLAKQTHGELSADEESSISEYTGSGYRDLNYALRVHGAVADEGEAILIVRDMDAIAGRSSLPNDIIVYREASARVSAEFATLKPGDMISDKGFMSASFNVKSADGFEKADGSRMVILARKGSKAIIPGYSSQHPTEDEVIFPRGVRMKFVGMSRIEGSSRFQFEVQ